MNALIKIISAVLLILNTASHANELTLTTEQGYALKASYYQSNQTSDRGVLLLHQCNYNRTMYNDIGQQLADKGIHALSLDFRGYGDSASGEFTPETFEALTKEERSVAWQALIAYWPNDVQLAYNYLKSKMSDKGIIGVIGASCGGSQAITLAENNPVSVIGFFSSGQSAENIARYQKALVDKPTLIIASEKDTGTFESAQKIFRSSTNISSKFIAYKGSAHGYPLLASDTQLASYMVSWLESQLVN
ncbi:alpha/beta hydrolase family protein [Colwellia hornerae]|uniref:Dienelactone hydrolase family protein n=1 Tax=Colwellia hornerae TaxID=89402 RepID=A0A5C6Q8G6_9GAMM|nr:dienelactone hydrolase family protein [Colwellia hornerae]TWX50602.1 dienelactone hydrolase family protein [Colwellia hornerae]TWX56158.1 dienelactone hydrolase family protein [Colwellia hornerae]TWX65002.1 dienelactone hydrolase family protein [Colwellia hornerae]